MLDGFIYFVFDEVTHSYCDSLVSVFFIPGFVSATHGDILLSLFTGEAGLCQMGQQWWENALFLGGPFASMTVGSMNAWSKIVWA